MNEIETTVDTKAEWEKSVELMQGLFPKWQTSNEQISSWKQEFGMLNPEWFREALHLTYHTYNSDSPKPKWVLASFRQVKARHQGIPLSEYECHELKRQQGEQEQDEHNLQVTADRDNARKQVATWTVDEVTHWGNLFAQQYNGMVDERNKLDDITTWSDTFTQFVYVFRNMQTQ